MTASHSVKNLETFGKHIADTVRYAIRGTSVYKPEEACNAVEKQVQQLADDCRAVIHHNHSLEQRVKYLERQLGITA